MVWSCPTTVAARSTQSKFPCIRQSAALRGRAGCAEQDDIAELVGDFAKRVFARLVPLRSPIHRSEQEETQEGQIDFAQQTVGLRFDEKASPEADIFLPLRDSGFSDVRRYLGENSNARAVVVVGFEDSVQMGFDRGVDANNSRASGDRVNALPNLGEHGPDSDVQDFGDDLVFRAKVIIYAGRAHARRVGDVAQRSGGVPLLPEDTRCAVEKVSPRFLAIGRRALYLAHAFAIRPASGCLFELH